MSGSRGRRVAESVLRSKRAALSLAGLSVAGVITAAACSRYEPPTDTGGVALGPGACGAVTVVSSDWEGGSSSVAVLGFDGAIRSKSIVSSASEKTALSAAFSGDLVAPTASTLAPRFVLIDRSADVLTWVDAKTGKVSAQLSVATGFHPNPQDYLDVTASKAYVSRYEDNTKTPGTQAFDLGGDLLVLDSEKPAIVGRIDLHDAFVDEPGIAPSPSRMLLLDGKAYILCSAYAHNFKNQGDSKLVVVDTATDAIESVTTLSGSHGCRGLAVSPDRSKLAVTCSGDYAGSNDPKLDTSALVVLDRAQLSTLARVPATTFGANPLAESIAFPTNDSVLFTTMGSLETTPTHRDALVRSSLDGSQHAVLLESKDQVVSLGEVRCQTECGACFVTDAERVEVDRFPIGASGLGAPTPIQVKDGIGALPRYLGAIGSR